MFTPEQSYDLILASLTLYREARGEPYTGKRAVASVIANRARIGGWFGKTPAQVVRKPYQFTSMTNPGDPNLVVWPDPDDRAWQECLSITASIQQGMLTDNTNGADHYLAPHALTTLPKWARDPNDPKSLNESLITARIGNHVFMRLT